MGFHSLSGTEDADTAKLGTARCRRRRRRSGSMRGVSPVDRIGRHGADSALMRKLTGRLGLGMRMVMMTAGLLHRRSRRCYRFPRGNLVQLLVVHRLVDAFFRRRRGGRGWRVRHSALVRRVVVGTHHGSPLINGADGTGRRLPVTTIDAISVRRLSR